MATHHVSILQHVNPDSSGQVWPEPYALRATNDVWKHRVWIFNDDDTSRVGLYGLFRVPDNYAGSSASIVLEWTAQVTTGNAVWDFDYRAVGDYFLRSGRLGLMTVYENRGQYDTSNVWFENGGIKVYDKKNRIPDMHHIDYGLGVFRAAAFDGFPRDAAVDLADVQKSLVARSQLAGYEVKERFYEIGSPEGLRELDQLLRSSP